MKNSKIIKFVIKVAIDGFIKHTNHKIHVLNTTTTGSKLPTKTHIPHIQRKTFIIRRSANIWYLDGTRFEARSVLSSQCPTRIVTVLFLIDDIKNITELVGATTSIA